MITRHHIALAILCTLILCIALVPSGDWAPEVHTPIQVDPFMVQENPGSSSSRIMMGVYYFNKNER